MEKSGSSIVSFISNLVQIIFWTGLLIILIFLAHQALQFGSLERERNAVLEKIQQERHTRVITLINRTETLSILGIPVTSYIDIEDSEAILRVIRRTPAQEPIDLILHTPGGLALAASQIAQALRQHEGQVIVFVPHYAMSGGTLIALAADEIVMDPNAVLGPVDPQIGVLPAVSIIAATKEKPAEKLEDFTLILADVSRKALGQMHQLVKDLLVGRMDEVKADSIAEFFTGGAVTHDFPITVSQMRSIGIQVSTDVPDRIYELMDLYAQEGSGRPSVDYVPLAAPPTGKKVEKPSS